MYPLREQGRWAKPIPKETEVIPAIYHCSIQIIGRSKGRSAVGAAAYRSGEKILNTWDGVTHDYTNKGGVIYKEILLPSHAPPEYAERAVLWNAVEQIEKNKHAQLAREINVALPVELGRGEQIDLVRNYCQKNFVDAGMCADFAIHDNYTGNPHAHILLTMRPFKVDGTWDDKQRKVYCRDENGNRIYDPQTRLYACETIATTDWNRREKAELWRSSWAELCNQYLARNDFDLKIDHRSYERQGIALKPTIHLGPSVTEMERRGIRTEKGDYNRTIMEENSMMRQVRARVSNLHGWSKNHAKGRTERIDQEVVWYLFQGNPRHTVAQKNRCLRAATYIQINRIQTPTDFHNKVEGLNTRYYRLNKAQQGAETEIRIMTEHLRMYDIWKYSWRYQRKLERLKPKRRIRFEKRHASKLHAYHTAIDYFAEHDLSMEDWNPPRWKSRLEKACKERYDCECVQTDVKKELECLETIRQAMNEMHRRQRRVEHDRGAR